MVTVLWLLLSVYWVVGCAVVGLLFLRPALFQTNSFTRGILAWGKWCTAGSPWQIPKRYKCWWKRVACTHLRIRTQDKNGSSLLHTESPHQIHACTPPR